LIASPKDRPEDSIHLLFEHAHFVCIHKPAGVNFHSEDDSVGVVEQVRQWLGSGNLFPVHRLDRMTSGLMLFARNAEANSVLSGLFAARQIGKTYLALSEHKPKQKQGRIVGDMARARHGAYKLRRTTENPAQTRFQCLGRVSMRTEDPALWAFALYPKTGQTHQLRVAMKSIGSAILGDTRYGGEPADRGYLHAWRLDFEAFGERFNLCDPHFLGAHVEMTVFESLLQNGLRPAAAHVP
jgi:tRNA pseudouridine32 synthase / 23S rRNA pseudouridine746 synthase